MAEEAARTEVNKVEESLSLAQNTSTCFRWGKEYSYIIPETEANRCIALHDKPDDVRQNVNTASSISAPYQPLLRSSLKFAAHSYKFTFNYAKNLPHYIRRMNEIVNDSNIPAKKRETIRGLLSKMNVEHATIMYGLLDVYSLVSKAQHGLSKVNQFPCEFSDRVDHLVEELTKFQSDEVEGELKKASPI